MSDTAAWTHPDLTASRNSTMEHPRQTHLSSRNNHPKLPQGCWLDCIANLCRRSPVLAISNQNHHPISPEGGPNELIPWMKDPSPSDIIAALDSAGCIGLNQGLIARTVIPLYNHMLSLHMLEEHGALSILCLQADDFRNIAIEYGAEAYRDLQACFQRILTNLWGASGCFRKNDILCRRTRHSNTYFILLESSRSQQSIPPPGTLEKLADRIINKIQSLIWEELFKKPEEKILPAYLRSIPGVSIGYATAIRNPCICAEEVVETLVKDSQQMAKVQMERIINRQREHTQALIRTRGILIPHFQAVFDAKKITHDQIRISHNENSLQPLSESIYGFESLIRVNAKQVERIIRSDGPVYVKAQYLTPDTIFSIASNVNLSLELDQACLTAASQYFKGLPGRLFANILPRNFYYVEKLEKILSSGVGLIFEVSESEAINNFDLILKTKKNIARKNFGIAIDDFGKGYAGLDRILKVKPDVVKLDRCLIENIHKATPKRAFVEGVINAARATNSLVLAEGIEKAEELICLQDLGIDLVQGYLLHKPQSIVAIKNDLGEIQHQLEPVA